MSDDTGGWAKGRGALGALLAAVVPILAYWIGTRMLGLGADPAFETTHFVMGCAVTFVIAGVVFIMGESVIEDFVKLAIMLLFVLSVWSVFGPVVGGIALGAPIGASLPLVLRMFGP